MSENRPLRRIRSFVRREGRLTPGQQEALDRLWPQFGLELNGGMIDGDQIFGRTAARVMEIGYGMGASLVEIAANHPEKDFIGIEVHRPGVGRLLRAIEELGLTNLRSYCADAVEVLEQCIPDGSLDEVYLFFPDPWHKKRHHKRRIVQPAFVELIAAKLKPGGHFHMATDWENYAEQMLEVMEASERFENSAGAGHYTPRPDYRPLTKFEQRGHRLGHGVWDLIYIRK